MRKKNHPLDHESDKWTIVFKKVSEIENRDGAQISNLSVEISVRGLLRLLSVKKKKKTLDELPNASHCPHIFPTFIL